MAQLRDRLVGLRRDLHRRPEPAWCEFYTTARIVEELERVGVDELYVGPDAVDADARMAVPDDPALAEWRRRAADDVDPELLDRLDGGFTGAVATLEHGEGPTVALRVDIDALPREESRSPDHRPAAEGFRSEHEGAMHACGHDAHATIGIGVLEAVADSDFAGTLKVIFQPAEERIGGGAAVAEGGHLDGVEYLLAVHVGLDHPTGEVVAGLEDFLAVRHFEATFAGESAHAGARPNEGRNAVQALAAAVGGLYAIPRHEDGPTRVNAGVVEGGTASNIVAESARIEGECRGGTTELMEYTAEHAARIVRSTGEMHDCEATIEWGPEAPSAASDDSLREVVADAAAGGAGVERVVDRDDLGGSEDAAYLMEHVQNRGGQAAYVCVGTDHPGGHHTATFDVDEDSLEIGVATLAGAIERIARERP
jgi:aminobenzoyl-glutamate utilization protein A